MKMTYNTTEQLITAYQAYTRTGSLKKAARASKIKYAAAANAIKQLTEYIANGTPIGVSPAYSQAVAVLRRDMVNGKTHEPTETNNIKRLELAFMDIAEIVNAEAEKRAERKLAEKEQEIKLLKESYEKELLRLQTIIAGMKDSSIVGMIKRKWQQ